MKLGLALTQTAFSAKPRIDLEEVRLVEDLGYDSVWAAEAYGCDAVTCATWLAAHTSRMKIGTSIMQIPARTPAACAMTTIGLDAPVGRTLHPRPGQFRATGRGGLARVAL